MPPKAGEYLPQIISWNVTYSCNLKCAHCYLDASASPDSQELTTEEGLRLIDDIARVSPGAMLVLSGGEPLLREDVFTLANQASRQGLMVVLGTNGTLLDSSVARKLTQSGVRGVGISLDSPTPDFHDRFRGVNWAWQRALEGIESCQQAGLVFQIQTTVTRDNYQLVPQMIEFAHRQGARVFDLFFLICTGRGQNLSDIEPQQYQSLLELLLECQPRYRPMLLRPRCAPYFVRLLQQRGKQEDFGYAAGCLAGTSYCRITPEGDLTPCPYLPLTLGNVRASGFEHLWHTSPELHIIRQGRLQGRCGHCDFFLSCRGCRARAYLQGNLLGEDPWCLYQPQGDRLAKVDTLQVANREKPLTWSPEAEARLSRVPFFLRPMVKRAAEAYAQRKGRPVITSELLDEMKPHRAG